MSDKTIGELLFSAGLVPAPIHEVETHDQPTSLMSLRVVWWVRAPCAKGLIDKCHDRAQRVETEGTAALLHSLPPNLLSRCGRLGHRAGVRSCAWHMLYNVWPFRFRFFEAPRKFGLDLCIGEAFECAHRR